MPKKPDKPQQKPPAKHPSLAGLFLARKRVASLDNELDAAKVDVKRLKAERAAALAGLFAVLDEMRSGQARLPGAAA